MPFAAKIKTLAARILDLIYKQKCVVCGCSKTDEILCKNCLKAVHKLPCYAQHIISGVQIYCASKYENSVKNLIRNLKFNHKKSASKACAAILYEHFKNVVDKNHDIKLENPVITAVPSHPLRVLSRGYCHTELIAKEFSKLCKIDCNFKLIKKVKNTTPQYKVAANKKKTNVRGAYTINSTQYRGETIIVIDDLITTGATLGEILEQFKNNNIESIICFTVACA